MATEFWPAAARSVRLADSWFAAAFFTPRRSQPFDRSAGARLSEILPPLPRSYWMAISVVAGAGVASLAVVAALVFRIFSGWSRMQADSVDGLQLNGAPLVWRRVDDVVMGVCRALLEIRSRRPRLQVNQYQRRRLRVVARPEPQRRSDSVGRHDGAARATEGRRQVLQDHARVRRRRPVFGQAHVASGRGDERQSDDGGSRSRSRAFCPFDARPARERAMCCGRQRCSRGSMCSRPWLCRRPKEPRAHVRRRHLPIRGEV